ncbi:carbohydrate-binding domain-containing protein [Pelagibacterium sp. H642]|uniref:carbohydrate-binding domain-containing protein n=1 Tax=Pelagibacterium sp. H642 TaxID=1881069 RepID=UPI0028161EB2|nr:carbohydrate-binding domain-containing protein [Pelagibacterium sp. H642]WMT89085.1 hypothetical protein NO934_09620 [Pelagibacterium sp. H642]
MNKLAIFSTALIVALGAAAAAKAENSTLAISLAGEAFDGAPVFEVRMGGIVIASGRLARPLDTKTEGRLYLSAEPLGYLENFEFTIPENRFDPFADISISLTNDRYVDEGHGHDRNLFIRSVAVNGAMRTGGELTVIAHGQNVDVAFQAGLLPVYEQGHAVVAAPPLEGWPSQPAAGAAQAGLAVLPEHVVNELAQALR